VTVPLPDDAARVCAAWLEIVDGLAPGLVTGLHVRGGIGLGEYVPGVSDIDVVAVLDHTPSYDEIGALEESHALLAEAEPTVPLDGLHVTATDLAGDPDDCPDVPCVLHGWFEPAGRFDVTPVGWHELAHHSVPVRGSLPEVWTSDARLAEFTRDALRGEWAEIAGSLDKFPAETATGEATWHVLGAARLHHVLVTGRQTSKSAAGRWGLGHYDERWHPVLREALRIREGTPAAGEYDDPAARGRDVAAFVHHVVGQAGVT
jgi:hypothetical protein